MIHFCKIKLIKNFIFSGCKTTHYIFEIQSLDALIQQNVDGLHNIILTPMIYGSIMHKKSPNSIKELEL